MMAHTRGGGYGNMAGSDDRTIEELIAELRERVVMGGGYADVAGDELERLIEWLMPLPDDPEERLLALRRRRNDVHQEIERHIDNWVKLIQKRDAA